MNYPAASDGVSAQNGITFKRPKERGIEPKLRNKSNQAYMLT